MAVIKLENMQFYAYHGCYAQEQLVGNRFRVDLELQYDSQRAQISDDVGDAVNYLAVYELVREQMMQKSHILENVSARILDVLGLHFRAVSWASVKVVKLSPPLGGHLEGVSVTLARSYF